MMNRMSIHTFTIALLLMAAGGMAHAQSDLTIIVADRYDRDTLLWGVRASATNGIDRAIGEEEFPPPPPSFIFDARWAGGAGELGQGVMTNYRRHESSRQSDTFNLRIQTGLDNYPVVVTWPDIESLFENATLRLVDNDGRVTRVDMRKKRSFTYTNSGTLSTVVITTSGPRSQSSTGNAHISNP